VSDFIPSDDGKEPLRGVNVDEAVALGAAIRANMDLEGKGLDFLLSPSSSGDGNAAPQNLLPRVKAIQDVISHSLGMISANEENTKFINQIILRKNSPIPSTYTRPFLVSTRKGGEHEVEVYMLQGESESPLDCSILGKYVFSGIEYIGKSKSILDITYNYTLNGTVEVSAVQQETGKPLILHIEPIPDDMSWVNKSPQELAIIDKKTEFITILLAIDLSGSMSDRPLMEAKKAAINLVHEMDLTCTDIGLIIFADHVKLNLKPNRDIETIIQGFNLGRRFCRYWQDAEPLLNSEYSVL
jgi:molecular chaperone DnaK (HSP70)